eukprot:CAMPEP_0195584606 /NCGR_PEP_ID=MMETSP0814-20130614/26229_1 /TAXON_ID=97485 /ORGANISM="Prymnesium parvum, Strain Texoma1" /LENGTH=31 /DNA_ID= /DNA_START= /DNA_END= /DNA_ORIENTATION=
MPPSEMLLAHLMMESLFHVSTSFTKDSSASS